MSMRLDDSTLWLCLIVKSVCDYDLKHLLSFWWSLGMTVRRDSGLLLSMYIFCTFLWMNARCDCGLLLHLLSAVCTFGWLYVVIVAYCSTCMSSSNVLDDYTLWMWLIDKHVCLLPMLLADCTLRFWLIAIPICLTLMPSDDYSLWVWLLSITDAFGCLYVVIVAYC